MLIDDDVLQQAEAGYQLDHPLAGGRVTGVARQAGSAGHEMCGDDRGAGTGAGHDDALGVAQPDALHHQRARQQCDQPGLIAAGDEDAGGVAEQLQRRLGVGVLSPLNPQPVRLRRPQLSERP